VKDRFIEKMQAAHDILVSDEPGGSSFNHHGFYSFMETADDKYEIQVSGGNFGHNPHLPIFVITSLKRNFVDSWTGFTEKEVAMFLECANLVAPVVDHWNGVNSGTVSIAWDFVPSDLAHSRSGVCIPDSYHEI